MVESRSRTIAKRRAEKGRRLLFERLARRALDQLPPAILTMLDNVELVIEAEPSPEQCEQRHPHSGGSAVIEPEVILGLYEGVPLTDRSSHDAFRLPDKITLFRGPLERATRGQHDLAKQIQITVVHELAHHFGLDEERIMELGWA